MATRFPGLQVARAQEVAVFPAKRGGVYRCVEGEIRTCFLPLHDGNDPRT